MDVRMLNERVQALVLGFALGDALGAPLEFITPNEGATHRQFYGIDNLTFTDDTMLVLSSLHAFQSSRHLLESPDRKAFWKEMRQQTCTWLIDWLDSGNLRGMGNTTVAAIKQMRRHYESFGNFEDFALTSRGYNTEMSAGNGILSRALPILALGFKPNQELKSWLKLTHVHEDGHASTSELATWLHKEVAPTFRFSEDAPGFYAPETLEIAVKSVVQAESAYECFCYSQRPEGDNDSTAALAIGLWAWKHGMNDELRKLVGRMARTDYELLTSLIGKT